MKKKCNVKNTGKGSTYTKVNNLCKHEFVNGSLVQNPFKLINFILK